MSMPNPFSGVTALPPDAIFFAAAAAKKATSPKADLIIGAYRDENGKPYPLPVVRKAEHLLLKQNLNYEYLPIAGYQPFITEALKVMYGRDYDPSKIVGVQTLSGTGAVTMGANLLREVCDATQTRVYLSDPTWANHRGIFETVGFKNVVTYRYYNPATRGLDFAGMTEDLKAAPEGSIVVLHQCAHNPTGVDPTKEQWKQLADLLMEKRHIVFFDSAYQGYASGDLEADAFACRYFLQRGVPFLLAQSFSKNLGLYNERLGTLSIVVDGPKTGKAVVSRLERIARVGYSNPPAHGARLAHIILSDPELRAEWERELGHMSGRIRKMREQLVAELKRNQAPGDWSHVTSQIGMFSYLGLTKEQCQYCVSKNVFITMTGRANMAGLTEQTVPFMAKVIAEAVRRAPAKL